MKDAVRPYCGSRVRGRHMAEEQRTRDSVPIQLTSWRVFLRGVDPPDVGRDNPQVAVQEARSPALLFPSSRGDSYCSLEVKTQGIPERSGRRLRKLENPFAPTCPCPALLHPTPLCFTLYHPVPPFPALFYPVPAFSILFHPVPPGPTLFHPNRMA